MVHGSNQSGNNGQPKRPGNARPGGCFADDDPAALAAYRAAIRATAAAAAKRLRSARPLSPGAVEHLTRSLTAERDPLLRRWYAAALRGAK